MLICLFRLPVLWQHNIVFDIVCDVFSEVQTSALLTFSEQVRGSLRGHFVCHELTSWATCDIMSHESYPTN